MAYCLFRVLTSFIRITTEMVTDPETGKSKRRLVLYQYDLGSCMFCHLCVDRQHRKDD